MPTETASPLLPIGAGRTVHKVYPAIGTGRSLGQGGTTGNLTPRPGSVDYADIVQGSFGIGGATTSLRAILGTAAIVLTDTGGAGEGTFVGFGDYFWPFIEALDGSFSTADVNCLRFSAILAGAFAGDAASDVGIQIVPGGPTGGGQVFAGLSSGIQFGPRGPARVSLRVRRAQAGVLTVDQDVAPAFMASITPNHWNEYEVRILGASKGTAAALKCLVNGIQVIPTISFAAATALLPGVIKVGAPNNGSVGYVCSLVNLFDVNSPSLGIYGMSLSLAPNEISLL